MKKILIPIILAMFAVCPFAGAQSQYEVTLPYTCGFENAAENALWNLNYRQMSSLHEFWTFGVGAHKTGTKSLYVYTTDPAIAEYYGDAAQRTIAYRQFDNLPAGAYDLAFDWRALGDATADKLYAFWLPANRLGNNTSTANSAIPTQWTSYEVTGGLSLNAAWKYFHTSVNVNAGTNYCLVFLWVNNATNTFNPGACVDDVQLALKGATPTACGSMPQNITVTEQEHVGYYVTWDALEQPVTYDLCFYVDGQIHVDTLRDINSNSIMLPFEDFGSGLYNFSVRSHCANGSYSAFNELSGVKCINRDALSAAANACPEVRLPSEVVPGETLKRIYPGCANLSHTIKPFIMAGGGQPAGYRVDPIPYNPPTPIYSQMSSITMDDKWDNIQDLPFGFCFFEGTYRQAIICANGQISFNPEVSGQSSGWSLQSKPDIPSPAFVGTGGYNWANCIYGVFEDVDPAYNYLSGGSIHYGVIGEAPCRMLVVTWDKVPSYQCHEPETFMTVLYEGTNVIDVYVKERHICSSWNNGRGIIGVINADGTDGVAAPGRNTTSPSWSVSPAAPEGWRFTPYSSPQYSVAYYNTTDINAEPIGYGDEIEISHDELPDTIMVAMQFTACNGDYIERRDTAVVVWPTLERIEKEATICEGGEYRDKYFTADHEGDYEYTLQDQTGCDSIYYHLILHEQKPVSRYQEATVCYGQSYRYRGQDISRSGLFAFTDLYKETGCDSLRDTLNLTILPEISYSIAKQDLIDGPTSGAIFLSDLPEGGYYSVNGVMNGPLTNLTAGDYRLVFYNDFGCATAPQTVTISGDCVDITLGEYPDHICADDGYIDIPFQILQGTMTSYDIIWEDAGHAARLTDKRELIAENNVFHIEIPADVKPGNYNAHIKVHDVLDCAAIDIPVPISIYYSSGIMAQKWGDVLAVYNSQYNGGFNFSRFRWYLNGEEISGEYMSYLNMTKTYEMLDLEGYYQVGLTRVGEEEEILSCPFFAYTYSEESSAPQLVRNGNMLNVTWPDVSGVAQIWNNAGQLISEISFSDGILSMGIPEDHGVYILTVKSDDGRRYSFKVVQ